MPVEQMQSTSPAASTPRPDEVWVPKSICEIVKDDDADEMPCNWTTTLREDRAIAKELT